MGNDPKISSPVKRGSAQLAVLTVLAEAPRHGYDIAKRIHQQTGGVVSFDVASLYPLLYTMERRGWVKGSWEDSGGRRRRCYRLTPLGKKRLTPLRAQWRPFFEALDSLAGVARA